MQYAFLPVFLFVACAIGLAVGLLLIASFFNPGRPGRVKQMPYESGMDPIHDTRRRFDVRFHLLAIAFLVFDVELLFLYPWAVASRPAEARDEGRVTMGGGQAEGGRGKAEGGRTELARPAPPIPLRNIDAAVAAGLVENRRLVFAGAMTFLALLTLGYVYDWRKGVFQWR